MIADRRPDPKSATDEDEAAKSKIAEQASLISTLRAQVEKEKTKGKSEASKLIKENMKLISWVHFDVGSDLLLTRGRLFPEKSSRSRSSWTIGDSQGHCDTLFQVVKYFIVR